MQQDLVCAPGGVLSSHIILTPKPQKNVSRSRRNRHQKKGADFYPHRRDLIQRRFAFLNAIPAPGWRIWRYISSREASSFHFQSEYNILDGDCGSES
jgi:hypothetical protein